VQFGALVYSVDSPGDHDQLVIGPGADVTQRR
jgi:hypothetical protein